MHTTIPRTFRHVAYLLLVISLPLFSYGQMDANQSIWITDLDQALAEPDRVYNLDLSGQQLEAIPTYLDRFPKLEALNLSNNQLTEIGSALNDLRHLKYLDLSGNQLKTIDFAGMVPLGYSLKGLWLRDNQLTTIDKTIENLPLLDLLDLGNNHITQVDETIVLKNLETLKLDDNLLRTFPAFTRQCNRLRELNLNANRIPSVSITAALRRLRILNIGGNPITTFELATADSQLEELILDWIDLDHLDVPKLPSSLRTLSMEHCELTTVPDQVYHLRKLEELSLIYNQLEHIPPALLELHSVKKIWVGTNPLTAHAHSALLAYKGKVEIVL